MCKPCWAKYMRERERNNGAVALPEHVDLTGKRFGKLSVMSVIGKRGRAYLTQCDCGASRTYDESALLSQRLTSCGCGQVERAASLGRKYGGGPAFQELNRKKTDARLARSDSEHLEMSRRRAKRYTDREISNLGDWYVMAQITRRSDLVAADVTPELIELKREQLRLLRLARELKQAIDERAGS